jgi:hypothetical protein
MQERVRKNTTDKVNRTIDDKIIEGISHYASLGDASITKRIKKLEKEWDTERILEVNMPIVAMIGLALGIFVSKWWFIFPTLVLLFFLQHAIQGWCPPLPIFRKLGYRTKEEINKEKYALKLLRGDFDEVLKLPKADTDASTLFKAVSK